MKRLLFTLIATILLCTQCVSANQDPIRVAFLPDMFGFYQIDENGSYSGYNYDYLMNISQHTGWEYEFVLIEEGLTSTSIIKAQEMLKNGEIDLLGSVSSSFDEFERGEENYGVFRYNLYSARNKYAIVCDNYFLQDTLRVALVDSLTDLNQSFLRIMEETGVELDITYVSTHSESHDLLFSEEVDAILNLDMSQNVENLDYLTTIQRTPFYFISTKGNTELIAQLDEAIRRVEIVEPEIHQVLLEKHFGTRYDGEFMFTEKESLLVSQLDSFKVGLLSNSPPYQYFDENGDIVGISIDILELFEEILDIPFEVIWSDSHDALVEMVENQEVDIIATLPNDYTLANSLNVTLTNPYISAGAYWLTSEQEVDDPKIIKHFVSSSIPYFSQHQVDTTPNIEIPLRELNEKGTYSIFCDPYITAYYTSLYQLDNIEVRAVTNLVTEISMGVASHIDVTLMGMLNWAVLYLDRYEVDEIIYHHTTMTPEYTLIDVLRDHSYKINAVLLLLATGVTLSVLKTSKKFRDLSQRDSLTKLYNAGYFHDFVEKTAPHIPAGTLILIDIDYFKDVNDTYGHHCGDEIIKQVAKNMSHYGHNQTTLARLGGDEFAVFVKGTGDIQVLQEQSTQFLASLAKNETNIPVTLSIGGFSFQNPLEYKELYKKADKVLYQVKDNGRNGFLFQQDETKPPLS